MLEMFPLSLLGRSMVSSARGHKEREREREKDIYIYIYSAVYVPIHTYIHGGL